MLLCVHPRCSLTASIQCGIVAAAFLDLQFKHARSSNGADPFVLNVGDVGLRELQGLTGADQSTAEDANSVSGLPLLLLPLLLLLLLPPSRPLLRLLQ